jgi:hypothetical protein
MWRTEITKGVARKRGQTFGEEKNFGIWLLSKSNRIREQISAD